jgi:hypothetical protein
LFSYTFSEKHENTGRESGPEIKQIRQLLNSWGQIKHRQLASTKPAFSPTVDNMSSIGAPEFDESADRNKTLSLINFIVFVTYQVLLFVLF